MNAPIKDEVLSMEMLKIVERYEDFLNYVYPVTLNIPRQHNALKDRFMDCALEQVELFNQAGKSGQISKLYLADSGLASLRFYLRFMVNPHRKLIKKDSVRRARRKIDFYRRTGNHLALERFVASWTGHAGWANSHNLTVKLGL